MLSAHQLHLSGRHGDLLAPTTLAAGPGLLLVQGDDQHTRTALALALSGRMRPTSGTVGREGRTGIRALRRTAALLDSPGVNAPEQHLRVLDLVAEDLACVPHRGIRPRPRHWLETAGMARLADAWLDQLEPADRLLLLGLLALENPAADLLVADSPDRHGPQDWLPVLTGFAAARPGLTVIAVVAGIPADWDGPVAVAGQGGTAPTTDLTTIADPEATA